MKILKKANCLLRHYFGKITLQFVQSWGSLMGLRVHEDVFMTLCVTFNSNCVYLFFTITLKPTIGPSTQRGLKRIDVDRIKISANITNPFYLGATKQLSDDNVIFSGWSIENGSAGERLGLWTVREKPPTQTSEYKNVTD